MSTEEKLAAWADGLELRAKFLSEADEDDWREEAGASVSVMNGAAAELRRLSAEVQELREAMRPFAECEPGPDDPLWGRFGDDETVSVLVEAANVKRARAALKPEPVNG